MPGPHNDDTPDLSQAVAFDVAEILDEYKPRAPEDLERLAAEAERRPERYLGGPDIARGVAAELRRLAKAMRDAAL